MTLHTYTAVVRINRPSGSSVSFKTTVQAEGMTAAQALLEAQYGQGNVSFVQRAN
jgi:20S proteasome alpha/beta subunit